MGSCLEKNGAYCLQRSGRRNSTAQLLNVSSALVTLCTLGNAMASPLKPLQLFGALTAAQDLLSLVAPPASLDSFPVAVFLTAL